jgi:curved DNA-binding protein CbpA
MLSVGDPYKVLQVDPEAEPEVIRAAYRALALKYHPDVSTGSQDRMAALNQAWRILRDPESRAAHDQAQAEAKRKPASPPPVVSYEMRAATPASPPARPPGAPAGSVLDFGRYAGWSLAQIAASDPEYLEWLARTPIGRPFQGEINALLVKCAAGAASAAAFAAAGAATDRRRRQHRRN